jgi:hypothetical protein
MAAHPKIRAEAYMTYFKVNRFSISDDTSLEYMNLWLSSVPRSRLYIRHLKFTQYFQDINELDGKQAVSRPIQLMTSCPNLTVISLGMPALCPNFDEPSAYDFEKFVETFMLKKILALSHLMKINLICYAGNDDTNWLLPWSQRTQKN